MNAYDIIIKPVITEQSMADVADKKYVFQVAINANKTEIKAAIEEIFGVKVTFANLINVYDVTNATKLVVDKAALAKIEEVFA